MSTSDINVALESFFNTSWGSETPVAYNNIAFDSNGLPEWAKFEVHFTVAKLESIGVDCAQQRQHGYINIQFYTPLKQGSLRTLALIDKATGLLSGRRIGDIIVRTPEVNIIGETESWYVSDIDFDFEYSFIR